MHKNEPSWQNTASELRSTNPKAWQSKLRALSKIAPAVDNNQHPGEALAFWLLDMRPGQGERIKRAVDLFYELFRSEQELDAMFTVLRRHASTVSQGAIKEQRHRPLQPCTLCALMINSTERSVSFHGSRIRRGMLDLTSANGARTHHGCIQRRKAEAKKVFTAYVQNKPSREVTLGWSYSTYVPQTSPDLVQAR